MSIGGRKSWTGSGFCIGSFADKVGHISSAKVDGCGSKAAGARIFVITRWSSLLIEPLSLRGKMLRTHAGYRENKATCTFNSFLRVPFRDTQQKWRKTRNSLEFSQSVANPQALFTEPRRKRRILSTRLGVGSEISSVPRLMNSWKPRD